MVGGVGIRAVGGGKGRLIDKIIVAATALVPRAFPDGKVGRVCWIASYATCQIKVNAAIGGELNGLCNFMREPFEIGAGFDDPNELDSTDAGWLL